MSTIETNFDPEEVADPATVQAILEIRRVPKGGFEPDIGSYGAVIWGRGREVKLWGAGYAPSDDILRAYGVRDILQECGGSNTAPVIVHSKGLQDQLGHVARSHNGKTRDGKSFAGYEVLKPLQEGLGTSWKLVPFKARGEPDGYKVALQQAMLALRKMQEWGPLITHHASRPHDHGIIITDRDPNPYGMEWPR